MPSFTEIFSKRRKIYSLWRKTRVDQTADEILLYRAYGIGVCVGFASVSINEIHSFFFFVFFGFFFFVWTQKLGMCGVAAYDKKNWLVFFLCCWNNERNVSLRYCMYRISECLWRKELKGIAICPGSEEPFKFNWQKNISSIRKNIGCLTWFSMGYVSIALWTSDIALHTQSDSIILLRWIFEPYKF